MPMAVWTSMCINVILYTANQSIVSNSAEITVYPNPNNGLFSITLSNPELVSSSQSIEVYNVLGEKIYSSLIIKNLLFTIDLRSKPGGIYFYRMLQTDGSVLGEGKLIIQK